MRKSTTLALSGLLVFSFSTVVYASANIKEVSAYLNNGVKCKMRKILQYPLHKLRNLSSCLQWKKGKAAKLP